MNFGYNFDFKESALMFDFMDSDGFIIGLEIVFLLFIGYDAWKYAKTKKREYIINIVLAIGFAIWVLYPFYTKYYTWEDKDRESLMQNCLNDHNASYCSCINNNIFKEYELKTFEAIDQNNDKDFLEFIEDVKKGCLED
jgi:hypothetical protein